LCTQIARWMAQKAKAADEINAQNENQLRVRQQKLLKDLSEAAKEPVNINYEHFGAPTVPFCAIISIPSYPDKKFDVHEGEVNAARFSSSGRLFASGGADRKVKIWEQVNGWADIHIFTLYLCLTKTRSTAQDLVSK